MTLLRNVSHSGLDRQAQRIIQELAALPPPRVRGITAIRQHYASTRQTLLWEKSPVGEIETVEQNGDVPTLTIFRPQGRNELQPLRTFLFFHGGGWTLGNLATYEPLCRKLCNALRANIIYVDYRLAPEHPYPAPLIDADQTARWVFANAFKLGISPVRIGVMGDSAGANLAAVLAIRNREGIFGEKFQSQVLIYPCLDLTCSMDSHTEFADGYLLTKDIYQWYVENYLQGHNPRDWHVSPFFARRLNGIAPAVVLDAGFDLLRDEGRAYTQRLRDEKVPVKEISFPDMMHGFINMGGVLEQADHAVLCIRAALHTLLANRLPPG